MLTFGKWRKDAGYYELEVMLDTKAGVSERFILLRAVKQGDGSYHPVVRSAVTGRLIAERTLSYKDSLSKAKKACVELLEFHFRHLCRETTEYLETVVKRRK